MVVAYLRSSLALRSRAALVAILAWRASGIRELLSWVESHGGWLSDTVRVRKAGSAGRGLFAVTDLRESETLASLPLEAVLLSEDAIREAPCSEQIAGFFANESGLPDGERQRIHGIFSIMVLLLAELERPTSPRLAPYFRNLASRWTRKARGRRPLFWSKALRSELAGTSALELFELGERGVEREYGLLSATCPQVSKRRSLEDYRHVWSLVNSHVLTYAGDPFAPAGADRGKNAQSALMPLFDLVNHYLPPPETVLRTKSDLDAHLRWSVGRYGLRPLSDAPAAPRHLQLWVERPLPRGSEVTDVYGLKANEDFLWTWGFTVPWIHNSTCLSTTTLTLHVADLPTSGPLAVPRRAALLRYDPLRFKVDSCLGDGFSQLIAFARFWYADATEEALRERCGLLAPAPWGSSDVWRLLPSCTLLAASAEQAALRLVNDTLRARHTRLAGGSLKEDEELLSNRSHLKGARRDAVVVRRDEKFVLQSADAWLRSKIVAGRATGFSRPVSRGTEL